MSLHVSQSPDAVRMLRTRHRDSIIASILISLLGIALVCALLALVLLPVMIRESPVIVISHPPERIDEPPVSPRPRVPSSTPSAPSMAPAARVLISSAPAANTIEVPEMVFESEFFGSGMDDFGSGGLDSGPGDGTAGGFGSTSALPGSLEGSLYDFKRGAGGESIAYQLSDRAAFVDRVTRLQRMNFSEAALKRHFRAPKRLYLTRLAIPDSAADVGPEFFGAKDSIEPSGWLAHYQGWIRVPKSGVYRFVGMGDDYLSVSLNGRIRLAACWSDIQGDVAGRWQPTDPTGAHPSPFGGMRLVYGDWVKMREGERIELDLAIGERPGGRVGFLLMIEERGVNYRKAADGRPILPLFTTAAMSPEERARVVGEFGTWEFEWDRMPVFGVE